MTTRFNGYNKLARLGYFMGDNAVIGIGCSKTDVFGATGVVAPLAEYKRMYAKSVDLDLGVMVSYLDFDPVTLNGGFWVDASDPDFVAPGVPNVDSAKMLEDFGVAFANDAEYVTAWAKQENLKKIVDTVQQRAVILAASEADAAGGEFTVSFLVERATVFDKLRPNLYGQPSSDTPSTGQELIDDLVGLRLYDATGALMTGLITGDLLITVGRSLPNIGVTP